MRLLGVEPRISRPQREVLTTILQTPGEVGYRSLYLPHAKRALYHLSYIPEFPFCRPPLIHITNQLTNQSKTSNSAPTNLSRRSLWPLRRVHRG